MLRSHREYQTSTNFEIYNWPARSRLVRRGAKELDVPLCSVVSFAGHWDCQETFRPNMLTHTSPVALRLEHQTTVLEGSSRSICALSEEPHMLQRTQYHDTRFERRQSSSPVVDQTHSMFAAIRTRSATDHRIETTGSAIRTRLFKPSTPTAESHRVPYRRQQAKASRGCRTCSCRIMSSDMRNWPSPLHPFPTPSIESHGVAWSCIPSTTGHSGDISLARARNRLLGDCLYMRTNIGRQGNFQLKWVQLGYQLPF